MQIKKKLKKITGLGAETGGKVTTSSVYMFRIQHSVVVISFYVINAVEKVALNESQSSHYSIPYNVYS
jgi:hypothetical protein